MMHTQILALLNESKTQSQHDKELSYISYIVSKCLHTTWKSIWIRVNSAIVIATLCPTVVQLQKN